MNSFGEVRCRDETTRYRQAIHLIEDSTQRNDNITKLQDRPVAYVCKIAHGNDRCWAHFDPVAVEYSAFRMKTYVVESVYKLI